MIDIKNLKVGDTVICVINTNSQLKIGKEYRVAGFLRDESGDDILVELIIEREERLLQYYSAYRFVTKTKWREYLIDDSLSSDFSLKMFFKKLSYLGLLSKFKSIPHHEALEELYELIDSIEKTNLDFQLDETFLSDENLSLFDEEHSKRDPNRYKIKF